MEQILKFKDEQKSLDLKYPNRHNEIHKKCCNPCPSNQDSINGRTDPESKDIKTLPKDVIVKEYLFVCFLRQNKLCKGLCDYMEISEDFIKKVYDKDKTM